MKFISNASGVRRLEQKYGQDFLSRAARDRGAQQRLRSQIVGRVCAATGVPQLDLRLSKSGGCGARVWNRPGQDLAGWARTDRI